MLWDEAVKINGADPDFQRCNLWDAIDKGDFPEWEFGVQVFDDAFADSFLFDILDATKIIPEEDVPVRIIGRLTLNRAVDNFFAETEQVAFCTQNIVPGIDFTNDPLLQGRNFSYLDTQVKRLGGPNFTHIPINAPKCPFAHFQADGHMAMTNPKGRANYEPNDWAKGGPRADPKSGFTHFPEEVTGEKRKVRAEHFADHYSQARQFYRSQTRVEQAHIADALVFELSKVETPEIRERMGAHLPNIDGELAAKVAEDLGLGAVPEAHEPARAVVDDLQPSPALSIQSNGPQSFAGRKLGVLLTDDIDPALVEGLRDAVEAAGGTAEPIAGTIGGVTALDGQHIAVRQKIDGAPSVLYDAVAIMATDDGVRKLIAMHPAKCFAADAFAHGKFIGLAGAAKKLFEAVGITETDGGMSDLGSGQPEKFVEMCADLRFWERIA